MTRTCFLSLLKREFILAVIFYSQNKQMMMHPLRISHIKITDDILPPFFFPLYSLFKKNV